jgi:hypothetical protein
MVDLLAATRGWIVLRVPMGWGRWLQHEVAQVVAVVDRISEGAGLGGDLGTRTPPVNDEAVHGWGTRNSAGYDETVMDRFFVGDALTAGA